jgi:DNA-directed RNA polymerase subunit RPC12/RpoP
MHIYTYECIECGDEFEVALDEDTGFSPGHFIFCDFCETRTLFLPVEHIEIHNVGVSYLTEH